MCLRAIKTKHYSTARTYPHQYPDLYFKQALQFPKPRRKGGKFDHRPERPKVMLRHCLHSTAVVYHSGRKALSTARVRRAGLLTTADTCLP